MVIRLQGTHYHNIKHTLRIVSWSESDNGRIRIELRGQKGSRYCHWLNPDEQQDFDKSKYPSTKFKKKEAQSKQKERQTND